MIEDMDELKIFLGGEVLQSNPYFIPKKLQDCIAEPSVQTAMSLYKAHLPHMPQAEVSGQGAMTFASERRSSISELLKCCVKDALPGNFQNDLIAQCNTLSFGGGSF